MTKEEKPSSSLSLLQIIAWLYLAIGLPFMFYGILSPIIGKQIYTGELSNNTARLITMFYWYGFTPINAAALFLLLPGRRFLRSASRGGSPNKHVRWPCRLIVILDFALIASLYVVFSSR